MTLKEESKDRERSSAPAAHDVRLPGWLLKEDKVGLGTLVKRATYRLGITPCSGGCERRAAALNRWVMFRR